MQEFSLQRARAGEAVVTRSGHAVEITHVRNSSFMFPIIAKVYEAGHKPKEIRYTYDGHEFGHGESENDLFML